MSQLLTLMIVALGGALGALSRYALGELSRVWINLPGWGAIMIANILGCMILSMGFMVFGSQIALVTGDSARMEDLELLRAMLLTGFCGALTTFSTFSLDTLVLWYEGRPWLAAINVLGTTVAGFFGIVVALEWLK